jgi:hypothetical protein
VWPDKNGRGTTTLLVEQVSHHPPITAYIIENKAKGLRLVGHNAQKTSFSSGSISVKQIGHAILTVALPSGEKDEFLITLPRLRIDGLWYGSPYIELCDSTYIIGGGHVSTVEYKGKGYFSGKSHSFKATMTAIPGQGRGNEYVIEGTWHEKSKYHKGGSGEFHNVEYPAEEVTILGGEPDGTMGPFETRNLWSAVAKGIREGDFDAASKEKTKIENDQRQMRKDEQQAGTKWALKHFEYQESDPVYERLGKYVKIVPPTEDVYVFLDNWPSSLANA